MVAKSACQQGGAAMIHGKLAIEDLVAEVQRRRGLGESSADLDNRVIEMLTPTLKRIAGRFTATARGSLSADDLFQVACIEALKLLGRYQERGSGFVSVVYRHAMSACRDVISSHAHDVAPAYNDRKRGVKVCKAQIGPVEPEVIASETSGETPEDLLVGAQTAARVRRMVNRLPAPMADLVAWVHGIGRPRKSLREVARDMNQPRAKLDALLKQGEVMLRDLIAAEVE